MLFSPGSVPGTKGASRRSAVAGPDPPPGGRPPNTGFYLILFFLTIGLCLLGYLILAGEKNQPSPTVIDEEGNVVLSPERQAKLQKELDEIDNAQQYVLLATVDGYYPCFTCPDGAATLFLYKGEVWRYGVTRKGEKVRYPGDDYGTPNVVYVVQFEGDYAACLKQEKIKIYHYPLLPEAQKRKVKLFRPPGNANDS